MTKKVKHVNFCEGCFCDGATWRAEGDCGVGLSLKKWVVEPKIQPRAQSLAQGLVRHFPKIIESQDHKSPNKMRTKTKKVYPSDIANKEPKEQLLGRASHYSLAGASLK